jgi:hypothetical protein
VRSTVFLLIAQRQRYTQFAALHHIINNQGSSGGKTFLVKSQMVSFKLTKVMSIEFKALAIITTFHPP